jgi:hypothetical protein
MLRLVLRRLLEGTNLGINRCNLFINRAGKSYTIVSGSVRDYTVFCTIIRSFIVRLTPYSILYDRRVVAFQNRVFGQPYSSSVPSASRHMMLCNVLNAFVKRLLSLSLFQSCSSQQLVACHSVLF